MTIKIHKRIPFGPVFQGLVADPEAKHYKRIRYAVWLYLYLIAFSNLRTGKLIAGLPDIARDMGLPEETLRSWLGHLRKWHYVTVERVGGGLLFKVAKWTDISSVLEPKPSAEQPKRPSWSGQRGSVSLNEKEHPLPDNPAEIASYLVDVLHGPGYKTRFETISNIYPKSIIQQALSETTAVPEGKIKKSRGALFVYLIKKYAQEQQPRLGD
ncbi:hypothetical protein DCC62_00445 [candidate division KSB1 bacterium]|nr:MAG: hypothetical protein DCC62_00445 [candidate division KSB1 bacterium]